MSFVQITQADLFNGTELAYAKDLVWQYKTTIETYLEQGTPHITPAVLLGLTQRKQTWESLTPLTLDQVRRFMTIYSFNHNTSIAKIYVLLDEQTKRAFMLISMFG